MIYCASQKEDSTDVIPDDYFPPYWDIFVKYGTPALLRNEKLPNAFLSAIRSNGPSQEISPPSSDEIKSLNNTKSRSQLQKVIVYNISF